MAQPDVSAGLVAEWRDVALAYPGGARIGPFSLAVRPGARVALFGPSGCGKSSLLRALTGLDADDAGARVSGVRRLFGGAAESRRPADWADRAAHLFQSPEANLCGMTIGEEVAFASEQRGLPPAETRARVTQALEAVGLASSSAARRTTALSGGERQLVAIAASLAQAPDLWLIDEPVAHLDAVAARRLAALLAGNAGRRAIVMVDHHFDDMIADFDHAVALDDAGRVLAEGPPAQLFREQGARVAERGLWRPEAMRIDAALRADGVELPVAPLTLEALGDGVRALPPDARDAARGVLAREAGRRIRTSRSERGPVVARLDRADCRTPGGAVAVRGASVALHAGEVLALVGPNGAGKSTLGYALAGLLRPAAGRREGGRGAVMFQAPELQFIAGDVEAEIAASGGATPAAEHLARWRLDGLARRHPLDLSEGQKRRLALSALDATPGLEALVLDEPTAGLDPASAAFLAERMRAMADGAEGARPRGVAVITHDMDLALAVADRIVALEAGRVVFNGAPLDLLENAESRVRLRLAEPTACRLRRILAALEGAE